VKGFGSVDPKPFFTGMIRVQVLQSLRRQVLTTYVYSNGTTFIANKDYEDGDTIKAVLGILQDVLSLKNVLKEITTQIILDRLLYKGHRDNTYKVRARFLTCYFYTCIVRI